ncbi:hypothetical protein NHP190003_04370 [Helicobacter sp. NHP19-003]|uniref:Phage-Barnase-EndoU-ColicinE5/D-RelE-like nuclease domain-containing protein n=1 Tax=Helicobacter gastrocanis TaxID=2849641 RepID=A0ABN6I6J9_9HELI|nr:PBECR2 nuclease fold domain-containing protein [Helicobacter sp. NHP19-003]BCZ17155.1 hypothetical protein NHP190003_04370 [Helicobacter sp. NHP19-003]
MPQQEPIGKDKNLEQEWLEAFGLKSVDEPFIPKFSQEVQEALEPILQGAQIQLTKGSLIKLEKRQREEFLPLIRPTLEQPNALVRQADGALIFVKDFGTTKFFASVARNDSGEWVITSNVPKTLNNLLNKVKEGGEVLMSDLPGLPIIAKPHDIAALSNGANQAKDTTTPLKNIEAQETLRVSPEFGENFAEFALKGAEAMKKLLQEKHGQVAGAFYRPDLGESGGYIDLVWGANAESLKGLKGANGKPLKPYGLSKIVEKHLEDFSPFAGDTPLEKLGNGIEEIIRSGDLVTDQAGAKTIILKDKGKEFRVGVSQGWEHKGKNYWIVTAHENRKSPAQKSDQVAAKSRHGSDLAQKDLNNSTTPKQNRKILR